MDARRAHVFAHPFHKGGQEIVPAAVKLDDVADVEVDDVAGRDLGPSQLHLQGDQGVFDVLLQGPFELDILLALLPLEGGHQPALDRFEVRHGDTGGDAAHRPVHVHLVTVDDDHVLGLADLGELWVDLAAHELDLDRMQGVPRLFKVVQKNGDHPVDQALLNGGEVPALNADVARPGTAEKGLHQGEDQFWFQDEEGVAAKGLHLENLQAAGHRQGADKGPEAVHLHGHGGDVDDAAQAVGQ